LKDVLAKVVNTTVDGFEAEYVEVQRVQVVASWIAVDNVKVIGK
jgi:hypothetical protein